MPISIEYIYFKHLITTMQKTIIIMFTGENMICFILTFYSKCHLMQKYSIIKFKNKIHATNMNEFEWDFPMYQILAITHIFIGWNLKWNCIKFLFFIGISNVFLIRVTIKNFSIDPIITMIGKNSFLIQFYSKRDALTRAFFRIPGFDFQTFWLNTFN